MSRCAGPSPNPFPNPFLSYLARGWSAIPILPGGKLPDTDLLPYVWDAEIQARRHSWKPFQHTRAGIVQARLWFARRPWGNVGLVTGRISGFLVLDLDGEAAIRDAQERGLPHTPTVRTAKGLHIYLKYPAQEGRKITNRANLLESNPPGYDIRAEGGYVVAPPSRHASGHLYQWEISPDEAELAVIPAWLECLLAPPPVPVAVDLPARTGAHTGADAASAGDDLDPSALRRQQAYVARAVQRELDTLASTQEGERNHQLNCAAFCLGQLVGAKVLDEEKVVQALVAVAMGTGLPQGEALKTTESGLRAGKAQPRRLPDFSQVEEED